MRNTHIRKNTQNGCVARLKLKTRVEAHGHIYMPEANSQPARNRGSVMEELLDKYRRNKADFYAEQELLGWL
jgi:phage pi2 protein 07